MEDEGRGEPPLVGVDPLVDPRGRAKRPRVLLAVMAPSLGGHTRTAVALAKELVRRGCSVEFLMGEPGADARLIEGAGYRLHSIPLNESGLFRAPFRRAVRRLLREGGFDGIHAVDLVQGVYELAWAARREGRFFLWTVPSGGAPKRGYLGINRAVVFTGEVARDVRRRSPSTAVEVLPARLDLEALRAIDAAEARRVLRARLGAEGRDLLVVRVARCHPLYVPSVELGIRLAERLTALGRPTRFLHVGYPQDPDSVAQIRDLVAAANARRGFRIAATETQDAVEGARAMAGSDICIASGRSALEALALGRMTLLAYGPRVLGLVDTSTIEALAESNFQGRSAEEAGEIEPLVVDLASRIEDRLADPEKDRRIRETCARFIEDRYSVEVAASRCIELYADRVVTLHPLPLHYGAVLLRRGVAGLRARAARPLRRAYAFRATICSR